MSKIDWKKVIEEDGYYEFEGIEKMSDEKQVTALLSLSKRAGDLKDTAKEYATKIATELGAEEIVDEEGSTVVWRVNSGKAKVDQDQFRKCYHDKYMELANAGKLEASAEDVEKAGATDCISRKSSTWLEFKK